MSGVKRILVIFKGVGIAYLISFLLILIYSALLTYTSVSESTIPTCVFVICMISVFMASSICVIKVRENGLKNGGLIGFLYVFLLYIFSSITSSGFMLNNYSIKTIIFNIIVGMIGGIIGVNLANR